MSLTAPAKAEAAEKAAVKNARESADASSGKAARADGKRVEHVAILTAMVIRTAHTPLKVNAMT